MKFDLSQLERIDFMVKDFSPDKFHDLSHLHPSMSELEFLSLKESIGVEGQLVPILIYRGKIVDGRHRWRALYELGEEKIKAWKIPNNFSLSAVEEVVVSMENRRHETKTQKAIRAWKMWKRKSGVTQQAAASQFGVSYKLVREVEQLHKLRGEEIINKLFEGIRITLISGRSTDSLPAIVKDAKERIAYETVHPSEYEEPSSSYLDSVAEDELVDKIAKEVLEKLEGEKTEVYKEAAKRIYQKLTDKYEQLSERERKMQEQYGQYAEMKK